MKLFINDTKTDFKLENEQNSYDVVNAVSDFASKSLPQQFITSIIINKQVHSYDEVTELKDIKIENIEEINIQTSDVTGIAVTTINNITGYLSYLKSSIQNENDNKNVNLDWMIEGMDLIFNVFDIKNENEKINFNDNVKQLTSILNNDRKEAEKIIEKLENSNFIIRKNLIDSFKIPDYDFLVFCIDSIKDKIEQIIPQLENIPMLFQTGNDGQTLEIINILTEIIEKATGIFKLFQDFLNLNEENFITGTSFNDFYKSITDNLKELMKSLENKDFVIIGDLLEYEFIPAVKNIKDVLGKIKKSIK